MPTFTGVCNWDQLPSVLAEHIQSTGLFTAGAGYSPDTSSTLRASCSGYQKSSTSRRWPEVPLDSEVIVSIYVTSRTDAGETSVLGWNGSDWVGLKFGTFDGWVKLPPGITQLQVKAWTNAYNSAHANITVQKCRIIPPDRNVVIIHNGVYWFHSSFDIWTDIAPYMTNVTPYPTHYLLHVETEHLILAVQGIYQVNTSARTHVVYMGQLSTPPGTPPAFAFATTMGSANLTAILSDNRRTEGISSYSVGTGWNVPAMNIDSDILLSPLYVYRSDEGWRGRFRSLYVANLTPGSLLNGETVTAPDGSKYTFFNIPASQDGYYNNFLASGATNQWLVVKH